MAVPEYQTFMLPLLQLAADQKEHLLSEAYEVLAQQFNLTEEERTALLPSGKQSRFENRVGWARTYLKKAELLDSVGRGKFRITSRGLDVLKTKPSSISRDFLTQYPEFREFQTRQNTKSDDERELIEQDKTPDEILDSTYQQLRRTLAQDLLERVKNGSPRFFENVVLDLLLAMVRWTHLSRHKKYHS